MRTEALNFKGLPAFTILLFAATAYACGERKFTDPERDPGAGGQGTGGDSPSDGGGMGGSDQNPQVLCDRGERRCKGEQPQVCLDGNGWDDDGTACFGAYTCDEELTSCVSEKTSRVVGGDFYRGNDSVTTTSAYPASISNFGLDRREVTVARFRSFVEAVVDGYSPPAGAGKHSYLNDGVGLSVSTGGFELGWNDAWNSFLPSTKAAWDSVDSLGGCGAARTWTSNLGANEDRPINCVNWYQSYAFCIWDGGFLPSEAEWNYAAAGGKEQRFLPWSRPSDSTAITASHAVFGGHRSPGVVANKSPSGDGKWLHADLIGNVWEWTLDFDGGYNPTCDDCADTASGAARVIRGGGLYQPASEMTTALREASDPTDQLAYLGVRCARSP